MKLFKYQHQIYETTLNRNKQLKSRRSIDIRQSLCLQYFDLTSTNLIIDLIHKYTKVYDRDNLINSVSFNSRIHKLELFSNIT